MITVRSGGMTCRDSKAHNEKEMQRIVCAYLSMEKENTQIMVYFNCAQGGNGIFANIDTNEHMYINWLGILLISLFAAKSLSRACNG